MTAFTSPPSTRQPGSRRPARTVRDVMRPGIVACARTATVSDLAQIMDECHTDCVVILSNGHGVDHLPVVWGLVTREDLRRPIAELDPRATAEQIARTPIVRTHADISIEQARSLCAAVGVSHLLVADHAHGAPLGIVSDAALEPLHHKSEDSLCTTPS